MYMAIEVSQHMFVLYLDKLFSMKEMIFRKNVSVHKTVCSTLTVHCMQLSFFHGYYILRNNKNKRKNLMNLSVPRNKSIKLCRFQNKKKRTPFGAKLYYARTLSVLRSKQLPENVARGKL